MAFKKFLAFMFVIDPKKRPSAEECLRHEFLQIKIADETGFS
jgi:hypothetical protein